MGQVIDTSVLVTMERRGLGLADLLVAFPVRGEEVVLSPFTVSEMLVGVQRTPLGPHRQRMEAFLEALLETIPLLPFGLREARSFGLLWAHLTTTGARIGILDALIAATALAQSYGVITDNLEHFQRVPGLSVAAPRWP